jgi:hypothetical protein
MPWNTRALPGLKQRKIVAGVACFVVAGCLAFWQGTVYQHGTDQTLISQYTPASVSGQAVQAVSVPTTSSSSAQSGASSASGAPVGP